ncbi:2-isopropylmalate synthase [Geovibrio ferrireducens]|jgi:2-isopropylmalate synthase|uniref:2-isopropylmalate synthase n=1 Tax=Geovibrio ferrireducens TaxID=46201 RepID=UPI0022478866|nr:2-isopropylmalate synthase [Geovibrio ferrireducens]
MSRKRVIIFDTTLRDGEQAPGFSMNTEEKIKMALQLEKLGVDVMEAGFPISSPGDFEAVQKVASVIKNAGVAGLCRANQKDIAVGWDALKGAVRPRIHTFLATSDIHLQYKLKKTREEVMEIATGAVKFARNLCGDVEFSCEDATRSDLDFLCQMVEAVIAAGASTVNLPDTVGYTVPFEYERIISTIMNKVPNIDKARISVHCHNDLGLASANSLAAIRAGATQVECTINGIGERAGNAAFEEVIMALNVRKDLFDVETNVNTREIYRASKLLTSITGVGVQPNKAVVGKNAFAHEAGIHQDGVLKNRITYEIMTPESVGYPSNALVLGKHSGRHAFIKRLEALGFTLDAEQTETAFNKFKVLADKKKEVFDEDLEMLVEQQLNESVKHFSVGTVTFASGNAGIPTATVELKNEQGEVMVDASIGDGPVDACLKAIERTTGIVGRLKSYKINALTAGKDAQGEVVLTVEFEKCGYDVTGRGSNTDVVVASAEAYVYAMNRYLSRKDHKKEMEDKGI